MTPIEAVIAMSELGLIVCAGFLLAIGALELAKLVRKKVKWLNF